MTDTYVTDEDGTGIVHQAPAFGEDDHRVALEHGIVRPEDMPPCPIDDAGRFTAEVTDFAGQNVKVWKTSRDMYTPMLTFFLPPGRRQGDPEGLEEQGSANRPVYPQPLISLLLEVCRLSFPLSQN